MMYAVISVLLGIVISFVHAGPTILSPRSLVPVSPLPPVVEVPKPYEFGYQSLDGLGTSQHHQEVSDGKVLQGSYGYQDPLGVYRTVKYVADDDGFRAVVSSNEPGMGSASSANAVYVIQPPPPAALVWPNPKLIAIKK